MIKVYFGAKINQVDWKIYTDFVGNNLSFFTFNSTPEDVANKLCQFTLFDLDQSIPKDLTYVVDVTDWKLSDKSTQDIIKELNSLDSTIIFKIEASSLKSKIFNDLQIEQIKATAVSQKSKQQLIHYFLTQEKITLSPETEAVLIGLLPEDINFIKNELSKLKLSGLEKFTDEDIRKIVFDTGDATIFNVIESWLNNNLEQTVERINELLAQNYLVSDIIPIFAYSLVQLKFFLLAKIARWSPSDITAKQGLAFWQQNKYANLKPYDQTLIKVNDMIYKIYNLDINVKKQKNIPYSQLIKILFE